MRKHVKPAHPDASIPDPERGRDLAAEGHPVSWTPYWAGLERRGDIIATAIEEPAASPEASGSPPPVSAVGDGIPFVITKATRAELRRRGVSEEDLATMTPAAAMAAVADQPTPDA